MEEQRRLVETGERLRIGDVGPQSKGALEVVGGVGQRSDLLRFEPGSHGGGEGVRLLVGCAPVVGEQRPSDVFGSARQLGLCGQRGCGRFVQPLALAGEQLVVHGFAHQRVAEPASLALQHQDLVGDGLAQRLADLADRPPGHGRQQPIVDRAADQRCLTQHGLDRLRKPGDAGEDRVANGVRERTRTRPHREQLLGVERVALGTGQDVVDDRVSRHPPGDASQEHGQLAAGHPGDLDVLDRRAAGQLAEQRPHRVATVDVVGSVADHQRNLRRTQVASQERDEVPGRRIGPMQVLDRHEQPGRALTHRLEQRHGLLEDRPRTHLAPVTPAGQQRPELGRHLAQQPIDHLDSERRPQPPQHLDERAVADPDVTEIDAAAHRRHAAAGLQPPAQLVDQAGLADSGVATDQHQLGLAPCGLGRTLELAQLGLAPDERRTRHPLRHRLSMDQRLSVRRACGLPDQHGPSVRMAAATRIRPDTSNPARRPLSPVARSSAIRDRTGADKGSPDARGPCRSG